MNPDAHLLIEGSASPSGGDVARQQRLLSSSRLLDHEAFFSAFQSWEGPSIDPSEPASIGPSQPIATNPPNDQQP